jgi:hypothetical protein
MLVSTYELLINKKQFPKAKDLPFPINSEQEAILNDLSREVIQGYFLTISNLMDRELMLCVSFNVISDSAENPFNRDNVAALIDFDGKNKKATLISASPEKSNYLVVLPAKDTGLLIVQPNPSFIFDPEQEIEIRGNVDVFAMSDNKDISFLLTPEHRATFYKRNLDGGTENPFVQLDQIAYTLPTANGGSLFKL